MIIEIRDAKLEDRDLINSLLHVSKAYWGYDETFMSFFMKKLSLSDSYIQKNSIKLFYVNNTLSGFFNFIINNDDDLELDNFFLHPDFIGRGLGKELWKACCRTAKEYNKKEFVIWSDPNAESFYLKMGCKKIGERQSPMMPNRYPPILKYILR